MDFRGRKALVTGAASGIGREIALALAREGCHLFLLDVDETGLQETANAAGQQGVEVVARHCDLTQPERITAAVEDVRRRWGRIDVLVNNAGIGFYGPTENMTAEQWDRLLAVNLLAPIQITRELLPDLRDRPDVCLLNVCSVAGLVAGPRFTAYHVSKFGLVGFTESLRAEYGRRGMNVTALCPGPVTTNLYASAGSSRPDKPAPSPPRWVCTTPERVARIAVRAMKRNRARVVITPLAHALFTVQRLTPWIFDAMNLFGRRKKLRKLRAEEAASEAVPAKTFRRDAA